MFSGVSVAPTIPARFTALGPEVFWRHFVSNNGLYDVWTLRNNDNKQNAKGSDSIYHVGHTAEA